MFKLNLVVIFYHLFNNPIYFNSNNIITSYLALLRGYQQQLVGVELVPYHLVPGTRGEGVEGGVGVLGGILTHFYPPLRFRN